MFSANLERMYWVKTPKIIQSVFPGLYWRIPNGKRHLYLTFDDGPTPGITEFVLDELQRFDAAATFFCLGKNVDRYPSIYARMLAEGHSAGNHSYSHKNGWETDDETYLDDVQKASQRIHSKLFRPPYGRISFSQINMLKPSHHIIMWDVLAGDFDRKLSKEKCWQNLERNVDSGSIIVLHDSVKAQDKVRFVLPRLLQTFTDKGYTFAPINLD